MKTYKYILPFIFFFIIQTNKAEKGTFAGNEFVYENNLMKQGLSFKNNTISLTSIFDKQTQKELLSKTDIPLFEFTVNKKEVNALMPVWQFIRHTQRKLNNGGTEYIFHFEGKGHYKGLIVELHRQYFDNSTLVREKLQLKTQKGPSFRLNKKDNQLHFIYPQISLNSGMNEPIQEIQLADYYPWAHMFRPLIRQHTLNKGETYLAKGPFTIIQTETHKIISTYEHASQDGAKGFRLSEIISKNKDEIDANQGVKGDDTILRDEDFWFIGHRCRTEKEYQVISTEILRGGYFDNELIPHDTYYETVWNSFSYTKKNEDIKTVISNYLLNQITEHPQSRESHFYYNTWGMQRESQRQGHDVRGIFTEERILQEIDYAAEMNVELFVLDDGWEQAHGEWSYHKERLPNGLSPLIEQMKKHHMIPGIWFSPMGIDSLSDRFRQHPDWIIRRADGQPILAQWDQPVFDYVGPFSELFLEDCKKLIDQGIRYFKWDAINTFNSALPNLYHGTDQQTKKERIERYNYLFPFYVTHTMKKIRDYNSEVLIEIDLTEPERCMIGLMPLQEAKFFFMNNGASAYGDYSAYRTKSMRTVINEYGHLFPKELFTYAVYPHNAPPYRAQSYHINTTLIAGNGTWGDLSLMSKTDRENVGKDFLQAKRIRPYIHGKPTHYQAKVGGTPEIYTQIDSLNTFGQILAFSGAALNHRHAVKTDPSRLLGILGHPYTSDRDSIYFTFDFEYPDDTKKAFIIGNLGEKVSITSSTGRLENVTLEDNTLTIQSRDASVIRIEYKDKKITQTVNGKIVKQEDEYVIINTEAQSTLLILFEDIRKDSNAGIHAGKGEKQTTEPLQPPQKGGLRKE